MSHIPKNINRLFNSKAKIQSPCFGCKDRTVEPNCHATGACERYEKFKKDYKDACIRERKANKAW